MNGEMPPLKRAPCFGEHSRQVLMDVLGISDDEFAQLMFDKVVY
jgi:hypothetical protein